MKQLRKSLLPVFAFLALSFACTAQPPAEYKMSDLGSAYYARLRDSFDRLETPKVFERKAEQKDYAALTENRKLFIANLFNADIIVHDPLVSPYLESLMNRLINASPQLFSERPRIFLSRSAVPNAYTTANGIIFVNSAYIYQTKTEADLLCCIGHELGHFLSQDMENASRNYISMVHSEAYKDSMKDAKKGKYNRYSRLEQTVKQYAFGSSGHSRYRESEADSIAVLLMHNAQIPFDARFFLRLDSLEAIRKLPLNRDLTLACTQLGLEGVSIPPMENAGRTKWKKSAKDSADEALLKTHPDCAERFRRTQKFSDTQPDTRLIPDSIREQVYFHLVQFAISRNNIGEAFYLLLRDTAVSRAKQQLYAALALHNLQTAARKMERAKTIGAVPPDDCSETYYRMQTMLMRLPEARIGQLLADTKAKITVPEWTMALLASEASEDNNTDKNKWILFETNPCHYLNEIVSPAR